MRISAVANYCALGIEPAQRRINPFVVPVLTGLSDVGKATQLRHRDDSVMRNKAATDLRCDSAAGPWKCGVK